jgi:WD40 repeat protein
MRGRLGRWVLVAVVGSTAFAAARLLLPCKPRVSIAFEGDVANLAISPDGALLVSASQLNEGVRVWDCTSGCLVAHWPCADLSFDCAAISADSRHVAAIDDNGQCFVWDVASRAQVSRMKLDDFPNESLPSVTFAADGRLFVLEPGFGGDGLRVWNGYTGRKLESRGGDGYVRFRSGSIVGIEGSRTPSLKVVDLVTGSCLARMPPQGRDDWSEACLFDFAQSAGVVACVGREELILRDIVSDQVRTIPANIDQDLADILGFASIGLSPDGQYLAVGPYDPFPGLEGLPALVLSTLPAPLAETLQPQSDRSIRVFGTSDGRERLRLPGAWPMFSPDGRTLLVHDPGSGWFRSVPTRINLYDVPFRGPAAASTSARSARGRIHIRPCAPLVTLERAASSWSDSTREPRRVMNRNRITRWLIVAVVAITAFESARLVLPCQPRCRFRLRNEAVDPLCEADAPLLSPDGNLFASIFLDDGPGTVARRIHVWDCADGRLVRDFPFEDGTPDSMAFSPDGRRLAAISSTGVCLVWDLTTGTTLSHAELDCPQDFLCQPRVVFGPDDEPRVVDLDPYETSLIVWNGATGRKLTTQLLEESIEMQERKGRPTMIFKDGTIVGLWSWDSRTLHIYDVAAERRVAAIAAAEVWQAGPDERRNVDCAAVAGILVTYDPEGPGLAVLNTVSGQTHAVEFDGVYSNTTIRLSPDGRVVAIGPCLARLESFVPPLVGDWLPASVATKISDGHTWDIVLFDLSDGNEKARLPGQWALFAPGRSRLLVFSEESGAERENSGWQARVYDLPLRGPLIASLLIALVCGGVALLATRRLVRHQSAA